MIVQDLALHDCHMVIFTANVLLKLLPNHYKVPENAPEAVSHSLKFKIFWGSMPPDPPSVHVFMHMYTGLWPSSFS